MASSPAEAVSAREGPWGGGGGAAQAEKAALRPLGGGGRPALPRGPRRAVGAAARTGDRERACPRAARHRPAFPAPGGRAGLSTSREAGIVLRKGLV